MASYRKICTRIWSDAKFRSLSDDGKLLFLFLLTHPALTSFGAMRATLPGLAGELGWLPERLSEAFGEAFAKGMVEHDDSACYVGLPNFIRYNLPESPNVVKSWKKLLDLLPECDALDRQLSITVQAVTAMGKGFEEALPEAFRKASRNPSGRHPLISELRTHIYETPLTPLEGGNGSSSKKPKRSKRSTFDPLAITLPAELDAAEFRDAWGRWVAFRKAKRKPISEGAAKEQLASFENWGMAAAIASIADSIRNDWTGVFPPKPQSGHGTNGHSPKVGKPLSGAELEFYASHGRLPG